ncbi:hypothetical protein G195_011417 [Phytophthora kernoviae 00238/432]|uniref:Cytosine deaminase n=1 Tax=Phytophthora kernoviae 00238/432 TaxID=1284355 RepID=A0A8J4S0V0_9STRA|nr:hypothetical protein G195_011417 [Phytophthora kernoviae 00238/432]
MPPTTATPHPIGLIASHIFEKLLDHQSLIALISSGEETNPTEHIKWSYATLLRHALDLRSELLQALPNTEDTALQPRIAMLGGRGASYLIIQWAIWLAGGIAVPLHPAHPADEMDYILSDSGSALLVANESFTTSKLKNYIAELPTRMNIPVIVRPDDVKGGDSSELATEQQQQVKRWVETQDYSKAGAYMVYTSGTTGRPKGVVTTHAGLTAQIADIVTAWEMSSSDHLVHFLPLHHVHGILNNLLCVMYAGGSVEFLSSAKTSLIWYKLGQAVGTKRPVSMFMAVPTVYMKLLEALEQQPKDDPKVQSAMTGARGLRVAISGSMACPVSILSRWESLTGLRLLERYGMTELGMVLTNPLHGDRHLGYVGNPFPSVSVRMVDPETERELPIHEEQEGELRVKGPSVFHEYWNKPEATAKEFDADGWFKTGDIVQYSNELQSFRIRGRASADILKTAGYKVSALDVERVLLTHPQVLECAVFGLPDETWGQVVATVIRTDVTPTTEDKKVVPDAFSPPLVDFTKEHLASYRVPRKYFFVDEIPKNAMGKVNKKLLTKLGQSAVSLPKTHLKQKNNLLIMDPFLQAAIDEAKQGLAEGGIPIGSVLVIDGKIVGRGHNRRVQRGSVVLHAEMDCLENAGRLTAADYSRATLYSTLSPCDMCSGAALLYKIPTVIVGENKTFQGPEDYVRSRGVDVKLLHDETCIKLMEDFIHDKPQLWNEDIGV